MKKRFNRLLIFLMVFISISLCSSCDSSSDTDKPDNDYNDLSQEDMDRYVAMAFTDAFWFIWNQNIAGTTSGMKDFTVAGPNGGSVHVTGSVGANSSTGINTLDLTLVMTGYAKLTSIADIPFNGTVTCKGSFRNQDDGSDYTTISHTSDSISYTGTVGPFDTEVQDSGSLGISETESSLCGKICGRDFTYYYDKQIIQ